MIGLDSLLPEIPIIGRLFDESEEDQLGRLRDTYGLYEGMDPKSVWENYNPEEYKYSTVQEDPSLREGQMDYLSKLAGLSETGLSDVDRLGFEKAGMLGRRQARQGREASMANAQARGVGGSGLEFAMSEMANQGGAEMARQQALESAAKAAEQRALYTQAYGNAMGQQRNQDFSINKYNTDLMNTYNRLNTSERNNGQKYNQQGRQDAAQQTFDNGMKRAGGMSGANTQQAGYYGNLSDKRAKRRTDNYDTLAKGAQMAFGGGGDMGGYDIEAMKKGAGFGDWGGIS